jgi:hypothetical protein
VKYFSAIEVPSVKYGLHRADLHRRPSQLISVATNLPTDRTIKTLVTPTNAQFTLDCAFVGVTKVLIHHNARNV